MDELKEKIADAIWPLTEWDGDYQNALAGADAVLAIPEIAEALSAKAQLDAAIERNNSRLLGPSISTNRRDPV